MGKNDAEKLKDCNFEHKNPLISYHGSYSAPGYGEANQFVYELIKLVEEKEKIKLDPTYTGKAFHYLHDLINTDKERVKTLFWMTYNSYDLNKVIESYPWENENNKYLDLPKKFQSIFLDDE